jgi:hypothetical protein
VGTRGPHAGPLSQRRVTAAGLPFLCQDLRLLLCQDLTPSRSI